MCEGRAGFSALRACPQGMREYVGSKLGAFERAQASYGKAKAFTKREETSRGTKRVVELFSASDFSMAARVRAGESICFSRYAHDQP